MVLIVEYRIQRTHSLNTKRARTLNIAQKGTLPSLQVCSQTQTQSLYGTNFAMTSKSRKGENVFSGAQIVIDYFQRSGARICNENENPAEWLLEVVHNSTIPWSDLWSTWREKCVIQDEIKHIKAQHLIRPQISTVDRKNKSEFASVFWYQLSAVTKRTMELDWRTPSYIYSKILMTVGAVSIFIPFLLPP